MCDDLTGIVSDDSGIQQQFFCPPVSGVLATGLRRTVEYATFVIYSAASARTSE